MELLGAFIAVIFLYSLVSGWLERTVVTAPIVFTAAGMVAFLVSPSAHAGAASQTVFLHVAEAGLVLLLFTDASRVGLGVLRNIRELPVRLLSGGMLLTLLLGGVAAVVVFPELTVWEAGILAAILAPTDAGLGQIIVNSPRVPLKIRQALNVEAGLNDGLSVPFLLFFIGMSGGGVEGNEAGLGRFIVEQLGYGAAVGLGLGLVGGRLLGVAHRRKWMSHGWQQLGVVALPILCLLVSRPIGASMFIAAFVAGLAVQRGFKVAAQHSVEFTEQWGQVFNLAVFFLFGLMVARAWPQFAWSHALYAGLSLTVIRMVPVAVALLGTRLHPATSLFMGWFGPRGLASIVLGLVYLDEVTRPADEGVIQYAVMVTVFLSIFAHGLSALPGMSLYSRTVRTLPPDAAEFAGTETKILAQSQPPV